MIKANILFTNPPQLDENSTTMIVKGVYGAEYETINQVSIPTLIVMILLHPNQRFHWLPLINHNCSMIIWITMYLFIILLYASNSGKSRQRI